MKADFKMFCVVTLLGLSVLLAMQNASNREFVVGIAEDFERNQRSQEIGEFRLAYEAIQKLEAHQVSDATYFLYVNANPDAISLRESDTPTWLAKDLEDFGVRYHQFMKEQCAMDNYDASLSYGNLLTKQEDFDSAYEALLKSANSGNYFAMAAMVDLYRNKKWSKHSEASAKEWLYKVGK